MQCKNFYPAELKVPAVYDLKHIFCVNPPYFKIEQTYKRQTLVSSFYLPISGIRFVVNLRSVTKKSLLIIANIVFNKSISDLKKKCQHF